jgi:hypothetical protein
MTNRRNRRTLEILNNIEIFAYWFMGIIIVILVWTMDSADVGLVFWLIILQALFWAIHGFLLDKLMPHEIAKKKLNPKKFPTLR